MKTILKILILATLLFNTSFAQSKKELSEFITELSSFGDIGRNNLDKNLDKLFLFGFGYYQNYSQSCTKKDGYVGVSVEDIKERVEEYFGYKLNTFPNYSKLKDIAAGIEFVENNCYYYIPGDGDPYLYLEVKSFKMLNNGIVFMSGILYYPDMDNEFSGIFIAKAKEKIWKGKKSWELISLKTIRN